MAGLNSGVGHFAEQRVPGPNALPLMACVLVLSSPQEQYTPAIQMYQNALRRFYDNRSAVVMLYLARCVQGLGCMSGLWVRPQSGEERNHMPGGPAACGECGLAPLGRPPVE